jgi:dihydrofolate reductase
LCVTLGWQVDLTVSPEEGDCRGRLLSLSGYGPGDHASAMSSAAFGGRIVVSATVGGLLMRSVTYSMGASLDGYIVGPDGTFDWAPPDAEVFRAWIDEIRGVDVHLMGRRLYETMLYWETADQDSSLGEAELEWAALWKPLPKVVFSTTLSEVQGTARLASGGLAAEIERLRAEPGEGEIAIGGATLAAQAAALGLIDEYRPMVYPVLVGGGIPFFPRQERRVDLELVETRTFSSKVVYLRYRVAR